jgi:hypothetical protein
MCWMPSPSGAARCGKGVGMFGFGGQVTPSRSRERPAVTSSHAFVRIPDNVVQDDGRIIDNICARSE